jgi:hypothetical protein
MLFDSEATPHFSLRADGPEGEMGRSLILIALGARAKPPALRVDS